MPIPRFEELTGATDGINVDFVAPSSYIAGTLSLWSRGLPRPLANDDGGFEVDPVAGTLTLKEAPLADDSVAAFYLEPTPAGADQVLELDATVDGDHIGAEITDTTELDAVLEGDTLEGTVLDVVELEGTIEGDEIFGTIEIC